MCVIRPNLGGRVTTFRHKASATELTGGEVEPKPPGGYGLLADRLIPHGGVAARQLEQQPYDFELVESTPRRAIVQLVGRSPAERVTDLQITKRLTLDHDVSELRVDYIISNTTGIGSGAIYAQPWFCNVMRPDGATANYPLTYHHPVNTGVEAFIRQGPDERGDNLWRDPVRNWRGVLDRRGRGAAVLFDLPNTRTIYSWLPPGSAYPDHPTFEWMYRTIQFDPVNTPEGEISGRPFQTHMTFMPIDRMPAIHGVGDGLIAALQWRDSETARVDLFPTRAVQDASFEFHRRTLPEGADTVVHSWSQALHTDQHVGWDIDAGPTTGHQVLRLIVRSGDTVLLDAERDFSFEAVKEPYTLARVEPMLPDQQPRVDTTVRIDLETPHEPWLRPFVGGPIRALLVVPWRSAREVVELAQRLEIDPRLVPTLSTGFAEDTRQTRGVVEQEIERQLDADPEVVLIGGMDFTPAFSTRLQTRILDHVRSGGGLVYVWPAGFDAIAQGAVSDSRAANELIGAFDLSAIPGYPSADPERWVRAYRLGAGRIVVLDTPINTDLMRRRALSAGGLTPKNPPQDADWPFWEYQLALVARATVWAAARTPATVIEHVDLSTHQIDPGTDDPIRMTVRVRHAASAGQAVLHVRRRDAWDRPIGEDVIKPIVLPVDGTVETSWVWSDPMPTGLVRFDAKLAVDGRFADIAGRTLIVRPSVMLEGVVTPGVAEPDGDVEASLTITPLPESRHGDAVLRWTLEDSLGRRLDTAIDSVRLDGRTLKLKWMPSIARAVFSRHRVLAELTDPAGTRLAQAVMPFAIDLRDRHVYTSLIWGGTQFGYTRQAELMALDQFDTFDTLVGGLTYTHPAHAADSTARFIAHAESASTHGYGIHVQGLYHLGRQPAGATVRDPALDDQSAVAGIAALVGEKARAIHRYAPTGYLLGDEMGLAGPNTINDLCQHPATLTRFRKTLQNRYESLTQLNSVWRTGFADWDEVTPPTFAEVLDGASPAGWNDHRAYMDTSVANFFTTLHDVIREDDPGAIVGYSGGATDNVAFTGTDRWKLYQVSGAVNDYGPDSVHMLRSFMPPGRRVAGWWWGMYGGGVEAERRHKPWHLIFNGLNSSSFFATYWRQNSVFYDLSIIHPDGTPKMDVLNDLRADVGTLTQGLGKLLLRVRRDHAGIAVYYSQRDERAAVLTGARGGITPERFRDARLGMQAILTDLGLGFDMIAPEQMLDGQLDERFGVLVLPAVQSMSASEAAVIEAFVRRGGVVLADGFTGVRDEHLRPLSNGRLDHLFGIDGSQVGPVSGGAVGTRRDTGGGLGIAPLMAGVPADENAAVVFVAPSQPRRVQWGGIRMAADDRDAGTQIGGAIHRRVDAGRVVLLNMDFASYLDLRRSEAVAPLLAWAGESLHRLGIEPATIVRPADGRPGMLAVYRFDLGEGELVGTLWDVTAGRIDRPIRVDWREPGHVYNVITGEYLGHARQVTLAASAPARHTLLAHLPVRPTGLDLVVPEQVRPGDELVVTASRTPATTDSAAVLHITFVDPTGREHRPYRRNPESRNGRFETRIPLALNDPIGTWTVHARDVITGLTATGEVHVKPETDSKQAR